ncbi:DNA binding [Ascochyta rabiei]|uniref:DNA binding n=1 Tax=Didymella rabiei TaxID=5454 RepID=A0A163LT21_DIDRA|nr:DNA binding [Ascochyta rabiei]
MAEHFLARGYRVAITGRRQQAVDETVCELRGGCAGSEVSGYVLDVDDLEAVGPLVRQVADHFGGLDIVVANAGIDGGGEVGGGHLNSDLAVVRTNMLGAMATIDAAVELFRATECGQVVAVSSIASLRGMPGGGSYSASKAGLSTYAESARVELRKTKIVVTTLLPGYIDTDINRHTERRPFVRTVEKGTRAMVDLVEAEVAPEIVYSGVTEALAWRVQLVDAAAILSNTGAVLSGVVFDEVGRGVARPRTASASRLRTDRSVPSESGGLHHAVELPCEGSFEATADVTLCLTLQGSVGFVGATLRMTPQPGDRDGRQCPVQGTVSASIQAMSGVQAATGLERSNAGERGKLEQPRQGRRPVAQATPAQQDVGATADPAQDRCRRVDRWKTDPGGDRLQRQYRDAVFDGGRCRRGRRFDAGELLDKRKPTQCGTRGQGTNRFPRATGSGTALVLAHKRTTRRTDRIEAIILRAAGSGTALVLAHKRTTRRTDRIEAIILRAAGSFEAADFGDVLTGLRQHVGETGGEASGPLQRPDPSTGCVPTRPDQYAGISSSVR